MRNKSIILFAFITAMVLQSCQQAQPGCMDPQAYNYNADATQSNETCTYRQDLLAGTYTVTEDWYSTNGCGAATNSYTATVAPHLTDKDKIIITMDNFAGHGATDTIIASFDNIPTGSITINSQIFTAGSTIITITSPAYGSISANNTTIQFSYNATTNTGCQLAGSVSMNKF